MFKLTVESPEKPEQNFHVELPAMRLKLYYGDKDKLIWSICAVEDAYGALSEIRDNNGVQVATTILGTEQDRKES